MHRFRTPTPTPASPPAPGSPRGTVVAPADGLAAPDEADRRSNRSSQAMLCSLIWHEATPRPVPGA
jgi:hypothetical protein